jgi:hypothetical protein
MAQTGRRGAATIIEGVCKPVWTKFCGFFDDGMFCQALQCLLGELILLGLVKLVISSNGADEGLIKVRRERFLWADVLAIWNMSHSCCVRRMHELVLTTSPCMGSRIGSGAILSRMYIGSHSGWRGSKVTFQHRHDR